MAAVVLIHPNSQTNKLASYTSLSALDPGNMYAIGIAKVALHSLSHFYLTRCSNSQTSQFLSIEVVKDEVHCRRFMKHYG